MAAIPHAWATLTDFSLITGPAGVFIPLLCDGYLPITFKAPQADPVPRKVYPPLNSGGTT